MKTFTNTHTNDSISIPLRYSIIEGTAKMLQPSVDTKTPGEL